METKIIRLDCRRKAAVEKTVTVEETPPTVDIPEMIWAGDSEFPLLGYYKRHLVSGITISKDEKWWSAILLVTSESGSESERKYVLHTWKYSHKKWLLHRKYHYYEEHIEQAIAALQEMLAVSHERVSV